MRRRANDEEGGNHCYCNYGHPIQVVERPPAVRAERPVETLFLHEFERSNTKLEICRAAPDSCNDSEGDPSRDVSTISQAIVEGNGNNTGVNPHESYQEDDSPSLLPMMPGEGQLR